MSAITCKFGGTSLADAACIRQVAQIINADPTRRYIVASAPGKRHPDDKKITDLLYAWHNIASQKLDPSEPREIIESRFAELARDLGVNFDTRTCLEEIDAQMRHDHTPDFMASRGEYINRDRKSTRLNSSHV